ncbi:MAG: MFS transporter, partial [Ktedonobacteraceae bacterium]
SGVLTPWQRIRANIYPTWLNRNMRLLLLARVCMSLARALAGIIVPIYLVILGFNALTMGLLFLAVALTSAVLSSLSGLLSDRIGRKPFLVILPFCTALAALVFIFSHVIAILFSFAALGSFGRGSGASAGAIGPYQPAEQALLSEIVPTRYRTQLFGLVALASSLGALIGTGPLTALPQLLTYIGILNSRGLASYYLTFAFIAGGALIAGLLALPVTDPFIARRQSTQPATNVATVGKVRQRRGIVLASSSWSVLFRLFASNSINGLAVGFFGPFVTYWFYLRYGAGPATIGLLFSIINLASIFANLAAAPFANRLGLVRAILVGRIVQAVLIVPMVLAPTFWLAGCIYLVRMLAQRIALPLRQSYIMGVIPAEERGTVGALSNLPSQATSAASPVLAGYIFDHISLSLPFEIGAILQATNALLFYFFFHKLLPPEEQAARAREAEQAQVVASAAYSMAEQKDLQAPPASIP